ncbi:unnamed protein product [Notodromas monacha]|uniref:Peptidase M14 domain-containing protein n=1 Tax=Notodromas monacha TaxID=399045 RepID=A0A7R9BPB1_9CRUS|nr:unnamed protein product [Notodromas monacha]CAG0919199.1 unnamed protein product [Notodromas monacha]
MRDMGQVLLSQLIFAIFFNSANAFLDPRFPNVVGYLVVRTTVDTSNEMAALVKKLNITSSLEDMTSRHVIGKVHFWKTPKKIGRRQGNIDILVSPGEFERIKKVVEDSGKSLSILHHNAYELFENSASRQTRSEAILNMTWTDYHSYNTITGFLENIAAKNKFASIHSIGKTFENREMKVLEINTANAQKGFWIDGGIHAREWISPAVVTFIVNEFVNNYEKHKDVVDAFRWFILPVANPDGYEYSRAEDRLWRKTRSVRPGVNCVGVDPNRNFPYKWMEVAGFNDDVCSPIYAGPNSASEKCVQNIMSFVMQKLQAESSPSKLVAFYIFHSYSEVWLSPWGWTDELPTSYSDLMRVAAAGTAAIKEVYGTVFEHGTSAQILPPLVSGAGDDWAYGDAKVPFVYTIELRDKGIHGFLLPPDQIVASGEEMLAGVKASAREILNILQENRKP